jgi:hypothetical protein
MSNQQEQHRDTREALSDILQIKGEFDAIAGRAESQPRKRRAPSLALAPAVLLPLGMAFALFGAWAFHASSQEGNSIAERHPLLEANPDLKQHDFSGAGLPPIPSRDTILPPGAMHGSDEPGSAPDQDGAPAPAGSPGINFAEQEFLLRQADGSFRMRCDNKFDMLLYLAQIASRHGLPQSVETDGGALVRLTNAKGDRLVLERGQGCSFREVAEADLPEELR